MLQKLLNKYNFKNNGILPMFQPGGFVAKPTASDSLAVMNSALAVQKYYDNLTKKGWYKKPVVSKRASHFDKKLLDEIEKESLKTYKSHLENPAFYKNIYTKNVYPTVTEEDIKKKALQSLSEIKNKKSNTYVYKDLIPIQIDEWAPSTLIDMRIKPQNTVSYSRKTSLEVPGSAVTSIMTYDPIAVKPAAMKTAADWAYMKKTYGTKPPAQQTGTTTKPPARQTINTTQGQVTGTVRPNQIKGSELTMMINPVRSKENLERMEMIPYTFNNPIGVPHGELLPITPMKLKQQGTNPYYGPGHTIIGYTDGNMHFYPAQQYTGAPNNQLNLQDKELLNNPEMLQKYVQSRDNYKFAEGGETNAKFFKILKDGEVNGKKLTDKQRKFFGAMAFKKYGPGGSVTPQQRPTQYSFLIKEGNGTNIGFNEKDYKLKMQAKGSNWKPVSLNEFKKQVQPYQNEKIQNIEKGYVDNRIPTDYAEYPYLEYDNNGNPTGNYSYQASPNYTGTIESIPILNYTLPINNNKLNIKGEKINLPMYSNQGVPVYGPNNTLIGYHDDKNVFRKTLNYSGAPNNVNNQKDYQLLNNPSELLNYITKKGYKFAEGGGIPERYKNMGFTNVGAKKDSTRPDKKWMVLAKKGEDYKVVHGGYQGMQDFKQHHSEQRRENFWNRMGGKDSAKANDPFSPLYWHKRFGTWKYGGQLPKFVLGGKDDGNDDGNGGVSDHYVNLGPLDYSRPKEEQQSLYGQLAMPQFKMEEEVKKPNVKTKTVREPFNQKYMRASNALFTGLDMLGKRNKNSYSNAIKDFNKNQLDYENNNVDLYSTKQDYYGMFSEGGPTDPKRKLKKFYETMSEDPTYYSDELEVLKDDYNKILQEEEAERNQSLEDYINGRVNSIEPEKVIVQDDVTYTPYRAPERIPLFYDQTNGQKPYQPTYAPELNIGFGALNRFNTARQMEHMRYKMGAKGKNNEIDCSGFACITVGAPIMTSEDLVVKGKNFRPYQGVQDLKEGTVIGYDFGPKKHDVGRKYGIDHVGVIVMNPVTKQLEYRESAGGVGVRTLTIPQFVERYPKRAKKTFVSDYAK